VRADVCEVDERHVSGGGEELPSLGWGGGRARWPVWLCRATGCLRASVGGEAQRGSQVQLRGVSWVDARCSKFLDWLGSPQVTSGSLLPAGRFGRAWAGAYETRH
jgi:hypothetical protein